jgi:hypothetical protein
MNITHRTSGDAGIQTYELYVQTGADPGILGGGTGSIGRVCWSCAARKADDLFFHCGNGNVARHTAYRDHNFVFSYLRAPHILHIFASYFRPGPTIIPKNFFRLRLWGDASQHLQWCIRACVQRTTC